MTITIELPDDLSARPAASLPAGERDAAECVAAVEEALADMDAGRTISFEEEMARWQQQKAALVSKTVTPPL